MKPTEYKPLVTFTEEALPAAAKTFLQAVGNHRVIAFYGGMGAGKTTFIAALCRELGVTEPVTSPTFAIVNEYAVNDELRKTNDESSIYHFDFYRIKRLEEAYDIGFEDYLYSGHLCLIEWPELIEELLPDDTLRVHITIADDGSRSIDIA
jgi:tRNA threonylcarbamoyladenosine biosynthesis protein TsaE